MKVVAAVFADFERTPLHGPSRLLERVAGRRVLDHALDRLLQIRGADEYWMIVDPSQTGPAAAAIGEACAKIRIAAIPRASQRRRLLETVRKYNLESWRGGPMNATWYDEFIDPAVAAELLEFSQADAAFFCEAHQAALDPTIASDQIAAMRARCDAAAMIFCPAPPGLAGIVLARPALQTLTSHHLTVGILLTYRPEFPGTDPLIHATCLHVDPEISATRARFCADTRRTLEQLGALFDHCGPDADAATLCSAHRRMMDGCVEPLPRELELELTTDTRAPESRLRPPIGEPRCLTDHAALARVLSELATYDDARLTVVGHGDPLLHPQFPEIARRIAAAGIFGVTLVSPLHAVSDDAFAALTCGAFDFLEVPLDATTPTTYADLHGVDLLGQAIANLDRVEKHRRETRDPRPVVVPTLMRSARNFAEADAFYDEWIKRIGSAVIRGHNDFGGVLPADSLLHVEPPVRRPCTRLWSRLTLLADGRAVRCAQDFAGAAPLGDWRTTSLRELWHSATLGDLRAAHGPLANAAYASQGLAVLPSLPSLCGPCREWFRP